MSPPTPYPLCWPDGMPRRQSGREPGQFKTGLSQAMKNVELSLAKFGRMSGKPVRNIVLSSNVTLGVSKPPDPGVAVWFTWEESQICIPVDRYSSAAANLQAIHHVLEARCTELRHGTLALVRATMKGFVALPAPKSWREVLGIPPDLPVRTEAELSALYRVAAKEAVTADALAEINMARDRARKELNL